MAVSRGLDRDRVVDETGDQTVVFGRRGSRPFKVEEMEMFYRHFAGLNPEGQTRRTGDFYEVDDIVAHDGKLMTRDGKALGEPLAFKSTEPETHVPPQSAKGPGWCEGANDEAVYPFIAFGQVESSSWGRSAVAFFRSPRPCRSRKP